MEAVHVPFSSQVSLLVKAFATLNATVMKGDRFIQTPWLPDVRQAVQQVFNHCHHSVPTLREINCIEYLKDIPVKCNAAFP